jgi:hypothetical protein
MTQQQFRNVHVRCQMQGRIAVVCPGINIGPVGQQQLHYIERPLLIIPVAMIRYGMQRRPPVRASAPNQSGIILNQQSDLIHVAIPCGVVKGRVLQFTSRG